MACLRLATDLACNELMQTWCSSFAKVDGHACETFDISSRINLVSPHLNTLVEAFNPILHLQTAATELPLIVRMPIHVRLPRIFRCSGAPQTPSIISQVVSLVNSRGLLGSNLEHPTVHRIA